MRRNNTIGEFEFDLRTVIKHIARSWKLLIVATIVGMIMLPLAVQGIRQQNDTSNNGEVVLSKSDEIQVERYQLVNTRLQEQEVYMEKYNQILSISPEESNAYVLHYLIVSEDDSLNSIKTAYFNKIVDKRDIAQNYLLTGFGVSSKWDDVLVVNQNTGSESGLYIKIYSYDKLSECKKDLETICEEICVMGLEHELLLIEETKEDGYDYSLAMYKNAVFDENRTLTERAATETYYLSVAALQYLGLSIVETPTNLGLKELVVYAVFGAVAGFLLVCMFVLVKYVCSKSPNTSTDIMSVFGISLLGKMQTEKIYKTDAFIDTIFGDKEKKYVDERWIKGTVKEILGDTELTEVAVLNLTKLEDIEGVRSFYQDMFGETKVNIIATSEDVLENAEIISSYDGVLLVVRKKSTLYETVNEYVDLCKKCGVKLLGYVVLD